MAELNDVALLLRRIPYSETSLICHFLTEKHGRIVLMARGARRAKSAFRASLAPLHELQLSWKEGRSDMGTLLDAQRHQPLLSEAKSLSGLEILALVSRLYQDGDPEGYLQTRYALDLIEAREGTEGTHAACWYLLHAAGWIGDLSHCWQCGKPIDGLENMYWHQSILRCAACGTGEPVAPGLRKSIDGVMQQATVRLTRRDATSWQHMIELVMKEHGVRFTANFS